LKALKIQNNLLSMGIKIAIPVIGVCLIIVAIIAIILGVISYRYYERYGFQL